VNGCGRSSSQAAYEESFHLLFRTLDTLEEKLSRQRYLCGPRQTEADWRLFPNLVRFDPISYQGYKCNLRRIEDYPNLSNYLRDLWQTPGIADVCDIEGMKRGVFGPAGPIKSNGIIPLGPWIDHARPHDRGRFG
jgi:putative glutathione S-transferase